MPLALANAAFDTARVGMSTTLSSDEMLSLSEVARRLNVPFCRAQRRVKAGLWVANSTGPCGLLLFAESRLAQLRDIDAALPSRRGRPRQQTDQTPALV